MRSFYLSNADVVGAEPGEGHGEDAGRVRGRELNLMVVKDARAIRVIERLVARAGRQAR